VPTRATAIVVTTPAGTTIVAAAPIWIETPTRVPEVAWAPCWERRGLGLGDGSRSQTGHP